LRTLSHTGPLALLDGTVDGRDLELAARLIARYSKGRNAERVNVEINLRDGTKHQMEVTPLPADNIPQEWHI
jgi:hypothetical protein